MDDRTRVYQGLLENPRFVAWVVGEAPNEDGFWQDWQTADPARREVLEQARTTILTIGGKPVIVSDEQVRTKIQQALATARQLEKQAEPERDRIRPLVTPWWRMAAAIALIAGLGWFLYKPADKPVLTQKPQQRDAMVPTDSSWNVVRNVHQVSRHVLLPDGSSAVLRKGSQLRYSASFSGAKREVYLSGEAFFEVSKDPKKPFFVYANELITKVVGTSFSVKAYGHEPQVVVVVKTGKVAVFAQADQRAESLRNNAELAGMVLMPRQQATFERTETRLVKTGSGGAEKTEMAIETQSFEYKATPVSQVFASLEKAYGVTIVFDEKVMARCSITATLGDEPLLKKLQWICTILEATYRMEGQQIVVSGKTC